MIQNMNHFIDVAETLVEPFRRVERVTEEWTRQLEAPAEALAKAFATVISAENFLRMHEPRSIAVETPIPMPSAVFDRFDCASAPKRRIGFWARGFRYY